MRPKPFVVSAVALAVGCTVGCTGSSTHSPSVAELSAEVCDVAFRCCDPAEAAFLVGPYVRAEDCPERIVRAGELQPAVVLAVIADSHPSIALPNFAALDRAVEDGRVSVDGEALSLCLQGLREAECNRPPEDVEPSEPTALCPRPEPEEPEEDPEEHPCARVFRGSVGAGGTCTSALGSLECEQGLSCATVDALGVEGKCVPRGELGDFCSADGDCGADLYCSQLDGTCQLFRAEGETCAFGNRDATVPDPSRVLLRCEAGLECDPVTDLCVAPCERGHPCVADEQCDEGQGLFCVAGRCDALRTADLPCADDDDCAEGLLCGSPADSSSPFPVCLAQLADGAECAQHRECLSGFCHPESGECAPIAAPSEPCPSGSDAQCGEALCDSSFAACATTADCPNGRPCDTAAGLCEPACVDRLADGEECTSGVECRSDECIDGICRRPPFALGEPCGADRHCESEFCGLEEERVCAELPLPNGRRCASSEQCESGLCFATDGELPTCVDGAGADASCGPGFLPCQPSAFFCDLNADPPACTPLRETGEACDDSVQCRGSCVVRFGRSMCDAVAPPGGAICDGAGGGES